MSIAPTDNTLRRSWTNEETDPTSNRFGMLLLLAVGIIGMTVLVLYLLYWSEAKTCAVTFSITDYGQRFPKPQYGVWQAADQKKLATDFGSKAWTFDEQLEFEGLQNTGDIKDKLAGLPGQLVKKDLRAQDTVVVQLRCHAAVTQNPEGKWTCGLIVGESALNDAFSFNDFLKDLQAVPARNIVLLADVCDLKSVPHRGLFVNPIATYLLKACSEIQPNRQNPQQNLWVICSAADFQTSHVSASHQKTLFQEACEHALEKIDRGNLFLADYYDQIFQYCNVATRGRQTPLMMLTGEPRICTPTERSWSSAKKAIVSWRGYQKPKPKDPPSKDKTNDPSTRSGNKTTSIAKPIAMHFVSMQVKQEAPPVNVAPKLSEAEANPTLAETEPILRYWQLRDELQSRKTVPWSPSDFAPLQWRKSQADTSMITSFTERITELEVLKKAMLEDSPAEATGTLTKAWNDFRESNKTRRLWQNYSVLPEPDRVAWKRMLEEYRKYSSLAAELLFWRDWTLEQLEIREESDEERGEIKTEYQVLYQVLNDAQRDLPSAIGEVALEKSKLLNLSKAEAARNKLHLLLAKRIKYVKENWENKELTWLHEREFQGLRNSPLLSLSERKELFGLKRPVGHQRPSKAVDRDLSTLSTDGYWLSFRKEWAELIQETAKLIPEFKISDANEISDSSEKMLEWGRDYVQTLKKSQSDSTTSLKVWHSLCFRELGIDVDIELARSYSGIVVSPTDAKGISLSYFSPDRPGIDSIDFKVGEKKTTLFLDVRQADDEAVMACDLVWNSNSEVLKDLQVFIDRDGNGRWVSIERNKAFPVQPKNKRVELQFELRQGKIIDVASTLTLLASKDGGKSIDKKTIDVTSNAEQIGLDANQILPGGKTFRPTFRYDSESPTFVFEFPAVNDALGQYRFSLVNKLKEEKFAKLRILRAPDGESLPGFLIAESELVTLPEKGSKEVLLRLKMQDKKNLDFSLDTDRLFFEIVECDKDGNESKKRPVIMLEARFASKNPSDFLEFDHEELAPNRKVIFSIKAKPQSQFWERSGLKQLPIDVDVERDDSRLGAQKLQVLPRLAPKILKPTESVKFEDGPLAMPDSVLRFHFSVGGYVRANNIYADVSRKTIEELPLAQAKILKVVPSIENQVPIDTCFVNMDNVYYFKYFLPNSERIAYRNLEFRCEVDRGDSKSANFAIQLGDVLQAPERSTDADRSCTANLGVSEDGMLEAKFRVTELIYTEKNFFKNPLLNGVYTVSLMSGEKNDKCDLVFDTDSPQPGRVEIDTRSGKPKLNPQGLPILYQGGFLSAMVNARDELSGLDRVDVAISKVRSDKAIFPEQGAALFKTVNPPQVNTKEGEALFDIKASEFEGLELSRGEYWIVARTYDRAGNYQNSNTALKIFWAKTKPPEGK